MSFLADERESSATLQAALSFIDAYDEGLTHEPADGSSVRHQRPLRASLQAKRRRIQTKTELQQLRQEVELLEATLTRAKALARPIGDGVAPPATTQWSDGLASYIETHSRCHHAPSSIELVVREFQRRRHSEAMNRKLKDLLGKQRKALNASESLLMRTMIQEDLALMYHSQQIMIRQQAGIDDVNVMAMLSSRLQQLQLDVDKTLAQTGLAGLDSAVFRSQRLVDQSLGVLIETVSTTLLVCSLEHTDMVFRRAFNGKVSRRDVYDEVEFHHGSRLRSESRLSVISLHEQEPTSSTGVFPCRMQNYEQSTRAVVCRYEQADRAIYVWTSATSFSGKIPLFIDDSMLVIRRDHSKNSHRSLLHFWHRVHADQRSNANQANEENVLRSQSSKVTEYLASLEGLIVA